MKLFIQLKCFSLIAFIFAFSAMYAAAQQTITGTVTDSSSGNTLPGVNILVKGTSIGTATDVNGHYKLQVESLQDTLRFSFIGYKTEVVPINGRTTLNIKLINQIVTGQQLVVVGYGTQRAENITSAVASISAKDFTISSPTDAASLIKDKVAGLEITNPSGNPTATSVISLRGATSLLVSNAPLVLVDGIPGSLSTVSPENIQSISVLKGGSAAAIYGSRGSNGAILIKTKNNVGGGTAIRYNGYVNIQTMSRSAPICFQQQSCASIRKNIPT
jgi:TonB-dependent SusC/RagA subfamily outer membrane receptor